MHLIWSTLASSKKALHHRARLTRRPRAALYLLQCAVASPACAQSGSFRQQEQRSPQREERQAALISRRVGRRSLAQVPQGPLELLAGIFL